MRRVSLLTHIFILRMCVNYPNHPQTEVRRTYLHTLLHLSITTYGSLRNDFGNDGRKKRKKERNELDEAARQGNSSRTDQLEHGTITTLQQFKEMPIPKCLTKTPDKKA